MLFFGIAVILGGLAVLMMLERLYPDQELKSVPGWWFRVLSINFCQLCITVLGMYTWEQWLQLPSLFHLQDYFSPFWGGLFAYFVNTWLFYWWHRARHEVYAFWVIFHQVHHSPQRIEAITSFYKHPFEILADSILMTVLLYPVLGLSSASSIWLSGFSAFGEYFYHMNIKTPQWLGYLFQRPECHRIHHLRNKRVNCDNYSDCPWWDMLGGTYNNPEVVNVPTGFKTEYETQFWNMLCFKDVLRLKTELMPTGRTWLGLLLLGLGCLQTVGYLFNQPAIRGLGTVSVSSPLPLVFSAYNGVETFSTRFDLELTFKDGTVVNMPLDRKIYSQLTGPYNLRNAYGVVLSHGPFFNQSELIELRDQVLNYGLCQSNSGLNFDLGISDDKNFGDIKQAIVTVRSKTRGRENDQWQIIINCHRV